MKRILNYPGSKWRLASWIIDHMPEHNTYLEPFFGSGAVFFNKQKSAVETINDIDGRIVNLFQVMRDQPQELARVVLNTPYARNEYDLSLVSAGEPLEDARRMMVRCWFAIGGKTSSKSGFRKLISDNGPYVVQDWNKMPNAIIEAGARLKGAQIEKLDALDLIQQHNRADVLIYADPPYLNETRSSKHYKNEYTDQNHSDLLDVLLDHQGPVILSGYDSEMYKKALKDWTIECKGVNALNGSKRTEILFINPIAAQYTNQLNLFETESK
ncbi:DNA adenine methylase [Listeria booriae]|uniref:DNA adenine methylase n=1 Tax=Listeria booriae TaxID=1552123 RepID=UPI001626C423|nr:DNA adenine methylase [Listeria booriae]MBC1209494.1 DNA adenine methylase [Listeria booriae]